MNMYPLDRGMYAQPTIMEAEALVQRGFTPEEIASLLRLRDWFQRRGSDRIEVVRHLEFLKFLVKTGKLP
jgi:hypothetical protein